MIVDDTIKFFSTHISKLITICYSIITNQISDYVEYSSTYGDEKNENLWSYLVVCIFVGSTVISLIPGQDKKFIMDDNDFILIVIITLWLWFLFSIYAFIVSKVLCGKAGFIQITKTSVVILATACFLSSLVYLTAAMAVKVIFNNGYKLEIPHAVYIAA